MSLKFADWEEAIKKLQEILAECPQDVIRFAYRFRDFCEKEFGPGDYQKTITSDAFPLELPRKNEKWMGKQTIHRIITVTVNVVSYPIYHNDTQTDRTIDIEWKYDRPLSSTYSRRIPWDKKEWAGKSL